MSIKDQRQLFYAFLKVGLLGYGGGPSSIPLVHKEVVDHYKMMTDEEFSDVLALGNTLPGPIGTKMAGYIGFRVGGYLGMINAVLATIVPTIIMMIVILTTLTAYKDHPGVVGMTRAVVPVVGVMLAVLTWQFFTNSRKELGIFSSIAMVLGSVILLEWLGIHPGVIIVFLLATALLKKDHIPKEEKGG